MGRRRTFRKRAIELFERSVSPIPEKRLSAFPHQMCGAGWLNQRGDDRQMRLPASPSCWIGTKPTTGAGCDHVRRRFLICWLSCAEETAWGWSDHARYGRRFAETAERVKRSNMRAKMYRRAAGDPAYSEPPPHPPLFTSALLDAVARTRATKKRGCDNSRRGAGAVSTAPQGCCSRHAANSQRQNAKPKHRPLFGPLICWLLRVASTP